VLAGQGALNEIASASSALVARAYDHTVPFSQTLQTHRASAAVLGPGAGLQDRLKAQVLSALDWGGPLVIDADGLSVFADDPKVLFQGLHAGCVLTPHMGEFTRLFPDLAEQGAQGRLNKIEMARQAAQRSGANLVLKGPDTIIAADTGQVRVNTHASARLATAGTGDVLAGMIGAFLAQGQGAFDAASAAVWLHGDAGRRLGAGAIVDDVLDNIPTALQALGAWRRRRSTQQRLTGSPL